MKRYLLFLLVAILSIGSMRAYDFIEGSFFYNLLSTSTVEITYDDGDEPELYSGSVTIPATITHNGNTYSVIGIGNQAFYNCTDLTSVTFGSNISSIGTSAFEDCSALTVITIPSKVTMIPDDAFSGTGLYKIEIPDSVTSIGPNAFWGCNNLKEVTIGKNVTTIDPNAFTSSNKITKLTWNAINCEAYFFDSWLEEVVFGDDVENIPNSFCSDESRLYSVTFGPKVKSIGQYAFSGCTSLTSIDWPTGLVSLGASAYSGCTGITSITIPSGITELASDVFSNTGITSIVIPDNITKIGSYALGSCDSLKEVTIGKNVETIDPNAFTSSNKITKLTWNAVNCAPYSFGTLEEVVIGDDIENIPNSFCSDESRLETVIFGSNVKSIGQYAFSGCTSLTSIDWPVGLVSLGASAYSGCTGITSITIPSGITELASDVFSNTGITSIVIPDNITKIGSYALGSCDSLKEVTIGKNVETIDPNAFTSSDKITKLTWNAVNCAPYSFGTLEEVVFGENIENIPNSFCSDESRLYSVTFGPKVKSIGQYAFSGCTSLTSIDWPTGLVSLGIGAYSGCTGITSITIPSGITELVSDVFSNTGITSIVIPDNITKIGSYALGSCDSLKEVTIGKNVETIDANAFTSSDKITKLTWNAVNCTPYSFGTLEEVVIGDDIVNIPNYFCSDESKLESVTFSPKVKSIGTYAFSGCSSLTSITILSSITYIESWAFSECANMNAVKFMGVTPPSLRDEVFPSTCDFYVPCRTKEAYLDALNEFRESSDYAIDSSQVIEEFSFTYSVISANAEQGSVTITKEPFSCDDLTLAFRADAEEGYMFSRWSDGNTDNPRQVMVTQDMAFVAIFRSGKSFKYAISVAANDPTMGTVMGGGPYYPDELITIMATPYQGCEFVEWSNGSKINPLSFRAHNDTMFTAVFSREVPPAPVICLDTMSFTAADTTLLAVRIYSPDEIEPYDRFIIAPIDNHAVMGAQGAYYRDSVAYVKGMDISQVAVVTAVPHDSLLRLQTAEGFLTPGNEARNALYADSVGADWIMAQYDSVVIPQTIHYDRRMLLYNETASRFSAYRQLTSIDRRQTAVFKLRAPRVVPVEPVVVVEDTTAWQEEETVMDSITVDVEPQDTVAVITTPQVEYVYSFTLFIWADEAHTQVLLIITYNSEGNQLNVTRPSAVRRLPAAGNIQVSFEVSDLTPNTTYHYTLVACEDDGSILTSLNSEFVTTAKPEPSNIGNLSGAQAQTIKFIHNGQIFIFRGGKIYTVTGQEVQ